MKTKQWFIVAAVILFGVFLRSHEYFENHSLWFDEANIAYKLTHLPVDKVIQDERGITGSLQPLPLGFIYVTKGAISFLGNNEFSLRLFPLICGIGSLFLFFIIAKEFFPYPWAVVVLFLFSVSRDLIYYSSELKPYSSDVLIALGIMLMFLNWEKIHNNKKLLVIAIAGGALAVWFSFISIFVLFSMGAGLFFLCMCRRGREGMRPLLTAALFWAISFSIYYFYSLRYYTNDQALSEYWRYFFSPAEKGPLGVLQWILVAFKHFFNINMQMPAGLAGFFVLAGSFSLFKQEQRKAIIAGAPILLVFILAIFHLYPFGGRVVTFLIPFVLLFMAAGVRMTCGFFEGRQARLISLVAVGMLSMYPLIYTARQFIEPSGIGEIKPVLSYIRNHIQEGDVIAVYYGALPSYRYYYKRYGLEDAPILTLVKKHIFDMAEGGVGREEIDRYQRVWALFSDVSYYENMNKRKVILRWLDEQGKKVDEFKVPVLPKAHGRTIEANTSASVYLYELNGKKT